MLGEEDGKESGASIDPIDAKRRVLIFIVHKHE